MMKLIKFLLNAEKAPFPNKREAYKGLYSK